MRSGVVRRRDVPLLVDMAIALAFVGTVTFFILVMESRIGRGELTQTELRLLGADIRVAHSTVPLSDGKQQHRKHKESKNGQRSSTQSIN